MNTRFTSLAVLGSAALAALACLGLWLLADPGPRERSAARAVLESPAAPAAAAGATTPIGTGDDLGRIEARGDGASAGSRAPGSRAVNGRLLLAREAPADERLLLRLVPEGLEARELVLDREGRFELEPALAGLQAELALEARYHLLEPPWRGTLDPAREIELAPRLGARLELELLAPPGSRHDELWPARVRLEGLGRARIEAFAEPDGRLSLGPLPAPWRAALSVESATFADLGLELVELVPGSTHRLTLALERGVSVAGRVLDARGRPIAGAQLELASTREGGLGRERERERTRSDERGRFALQPVRAGAATLTAEHDEHARLVLELGTLADGRRVEDLQLVLPAALLAVGRLAWSDGGPVPGARLELSGEGFERVRTTSGPAGEFTLALPPGFERGTLEARAPEALRAPGGASGLSRRVPLEGVPRGALELVLDGPASLEGRVVDERGEPFPGAEVWVRREGGELTARLALEEEESNFRFTGLEPGALAARAELSDESGRVQLRGPLVRGRTGAPLELVLPRPASLAGRVLGPEGGPAAGAKVRVGAGRRARELRCDESGAFELTLLAAGAHELQAEDEAGARSRPLELELSAGERREELVLELARAASLAGRILGAPGEVGSRALELRPAERGLARRRARTDGEGAFRFEGLAAGRWTLVLPPRESLLRPGLASELLASLRTELTLELGPGEEGFVELLEAHLDARDEELVRGRVLEAGRGVGAVELVWRPLAGERVRRFALSAADGSFTIRVPQSEAYEVELRLEDGGRVRFERVLAGAGAEVVLELPGGRLRGRLVVPEGHPSAGIALELQGSGPAARRGASQGSARSGADGSFEFTRLAPGTYVLRAGGGASGLAELVRPAIALERGASIELGALELGEGAELRGRAIDAEGRGIPRARVRVFDAEGRRLLLGGSSQTDGRGGFRWRSLPAGELRVQVLPRGLAALERRVRVEPGGRHELDLRFPR